LTPGQGLLVTALSASVLAVGGATAGESPTAPPGPRFREFSGVCQGRPDGPLWDHSLAWDRWDLPWNECEPTRGAWNEERLAEFGRQVLACRQRGARLLPVLAYNSAWSWDRGERSFQHGDRRWQVVPRADEEFAVTEAKRAGDGSWTQVKQDVRKGGLTWPLAAERVPDWEAFVRRAVEFLRQPLYGVEYFQVWNEAHPDSGFWFGDLDTYMERVHLPAARAIRAAGGKVVYGGWPCCGSITGFVELLDRHQAWGSVDVLDVHYFGIAAWPQLLAAATARGHGNLALWQTEVGFTQDPGFILNDYPRALGWALRQAWDRPERFVLFYFAFWSPDDPKAFGYGCTLYSGTHLAVHGRGLALLGELLDGSGLRAFPGVRSEPPVELALDGGQSSLEAFAVEDRIVVAVHWRRAAPGEAAPETLTLTLPGLAPDTIREVTRRGLDQEAVDLRGAVRPAPPTGAAVQVPLPPWAVPAEETPAGPPGQVTTFFVVFRLAPGPR
jgi:hypothetical protein